MPAKQLEISLLQVFSQLTTQRSGFKQNSCAVDEQAGMLCLVAVSVTNTLF